MTVDVPESMTKTFVRISTGERQIKFADSQDEAVAWLEGYELMSDAHLVSDLSGHVAEVYGTGSSERAWEALPSLGAPSGKTLDAARSVLVEHIAALGHDSNAPRSPELDLLTELLANWPRL